MATDKSVYQSFQTSLGTIRQSLTDLSETISTADNHTEIEDDFNQIFNSFSAIDSWAQDNIQRIEEESVLNSFLEQLKDLFTEFNAKVEVVDVTSGTGYGEAYGGGATETPGIKFSVSKDGVSSEKVFEKGSLTKDDF